VKIGVTEAALSRYVSGKRVPKATTIAKMAKVLNCDVNYLINFEQEN
jgi:transcriptional regulator with XRE-family HTH domain